MSWLAVIICLIANLGFSESIFLKPLQANQVLEKLSQSSSIASSKEQLTKEWQKSAPKLELREIAAFIANNHKAFLTTLQDFDNQKFKTAKEFIAKFPKPKAGYDFAESQIIFYAAFSWGQQKNYEEAHVLIKELNPVNLIDPSAYYFYRALCEKDIRDKDAALKSLKVLLTGIQGGPERYHHVGEMLKEEIENWQEDVGDVARRMSEVQNRLENSKGGNKTQALQKEIVKKLDDLIKQTEDEMNKQNQGSQSAAGKQQQSQPAPDSKIMQGAGKGEVQNKKLIQSSEVWGKMPEKEKVKAMEALSRQLPPHIREAAEGFSKKLGQQGKKP
jgi:hypothetical protein